MVNTDGTVVASSGDFNLNVGQTAFFDFPWATLMGFANNVDQFNARAQVRVVVEISANGQLPPGPCMPGVELLDAGTLETQALIVPPQPETF
jgi:hypothetical protein